MSTVLSVMAVLGLVAAGTVAVALASFVFVDWIWRNTR